MKRITKKHGKRMDTVVKKVGFDLSRELILGTPVQDGTARRNWFVSMNKPTQEFIDEQDKNGGKTVSAAFAEVSKYRSGDSIYMVNSTPYIKRLEEGWSAQRPNGWVNRAARKFNSLLRKAAKQA